MANTEGMSDEVMASLLTPDAASTTTRSSARQTKSAFARQAALQRRLGQPIGERPAATVIRASPHVKSTEGNESPSNEENGPLPADKPNEAPPILGSVVERDIATVSKTAAGTGRPKSRFAAQRQGNKSVNNKGFPSVHMPIGTFVNKNPVTKTRQQEHAAPALTENATQRDAQALLDQMTFSEIRENVQDLQAALSPDTIAFLKQRGQQRARNNRPTGQNVQQESRSDQQVLRALNTSDDVKEKQRVADKLSAIRTYDELDAMYAAENGTAADEHEEAAEEDWDTACNLLRSTVPRQTVWAARVVCQQLEADVSAGKSFPVGGQDPWPYPVLLPVSLRCLLDVSISQSNGFVLQTYVLRSLYALLQLRAHTDHVVYVSCSRDTASSVFQEYFMDDAAPTPPFGTCYPSISAQPVASTKDGEAVAYSTSSSSTSAKQDGEAFAKDPMWTLLSRMRILPRLAGLLSAAQTDFKLADEGVIAICGILSMLCMRSAGAASAISQHPVVLSSLLRIAVLPATDEGDSFYSGFFNEKVALASVVLLCTLARQSRTAAMALPIDSVVLPILAMDVQTEEEHQLQKWALILWRTTLRYGIGLSSLSTYVSLSIPHLATERPSGKFSLAVEFISAFTNICHCVRIARSKPANEWSRVMSPDESEGLSMALKWLNTAFRQTVEHAKCIAHHSYQSLLPDMRLAAARVDFLHSYISAVEHGDPDSMESKREDDDIFDLNGVLIATKQIAESELVQKAFSMIPSYGFRPVPLDLDSEGWIDVVLMQQEATACALIDAVASLLSTMTRYVEQSGQVQQEDSNVLVAAVSTSFRAWVLDWLNAPTAISSSLDGLAPTIPRARVGWLNTTNFHISRFLIHEFPHEIADLAIVRSHAFSLIGRLELGEEAFAAILCSNDVLFNSSGASQSSASPLSSFLLKELCTTPLARQQLDHSFKLHRGFGLTAEEWGPFGMDTLLSETDAKESSGPAPFTELLLPMGSLWVSKILSGTDLEETVPNGAAGGQDILSVIDVLSACLELLLSLEEEKSDDYMSYAAGLPDGAKLYYLMNVCLHQESVLRNDRINELLMTLFDRYTERLRENANSTENGLAASFSQSCFNHSHISAGNQIANESESDKVDSNDEKLLSLLMGESETKKKEMQALSDFLTDLTKAYIEYGAQYEAFTKCIRVFLSASFPPQIRCEAIHGLRDVLHLLTLPGEEANPVGPEMISALNICLYANDLHENVLGRDPSQVLDSIASVVRRDPGMPGSASKWNVSNGGFFFEFSIASLARSLTNSIEQEAPSSFEATKRRIMAISGEAAELVIETTFRFLRSENKQRDDLISAVISTIRDYKISPTRRHIVGPEVDTESFETAVAKLKQAGMDCDHPGSSPRIA